MDRRALDIANSFYKFFMENKLDGMPYDDFAYASAIAKWERQGKPNKAWFSTEDPALLDNAGKLTLHYGLPIVTREEGIRREESGRTIRHVVDETTWLTDLGIINPFEDK